MLAIFVVALTETYCIKTKLANRKKKLSLNFELSIDPFHKWILISKLASSSVLNGVQLKLIMIR